MNIREQIEWLRKMIKRWHESAASPDQLNRLIETKDTMEKLNAVYEAAIEYGDARTSDERFDAAESYVRLRDAVNGVLSEQ